MRNIAPQIVNYAQYSITITFVANQYPDCTNIIDLGKRNTLPTHLSPNAIDMFWSTIYLTVNTNLLNPAIQFGYHIGNVLLPDGSLLV